MNELRPVGEGIPSGNKQIHSNGGQESPLARARAKASEDTLEQA